MTRSARVYQLACVLTAVAVLAAVAAPAQRQLIAGRTADMPAGDAAKTQGLDSFSLGLLLGGFRGPLVMYLWVASEEDKNHERTEQFLTQAKLIGNLEPQFASIYVHQSWNLAYNVSVQYNRDTEKYRWVMEGIHFAELGDQRLPRNADILAQLGHLYSDKLGDSYEAPYFRARFRKDSLAGNADEVPVLDAANRLTPTYARRWPYADHLDGILAVIARNTQAVVKSPIPPGPIQDWPAKDRALAWDSPAAKHVWPYGVSVYAVAYDYLKQATFAGPHANFSKSVMSSRPALACRAWLKDELNLALDAEANLWPIDQLNQPLPVPDAAKLSPADPAMAEAMDHYHEAQRVARLAHGEYLLHLANFPGDYDIYITHMNDVELKSQMADAGALRLAGIAEWLAARKAGNAAAVESARQKLAQARTDYLNVVPLIHDYVETEYHLNSWGQEENADARQGYLKLADQAERAASQIERMLR